MRVLTVNAGSASLKLRLLAGDSLLASHNVQPWDGDIAPIQEFLDGSGAEAIGHRVVHGGTRIQQATTVDDDVVRYLGSLTPLAPLHQVHALEAVRAMTGLAPDIPSVVCVDTAFHLNLPASAATYALPSEWNRRWSLRRFGFHGLSHDYAALRGAEITGLEGHRGKVLSAHLGAGASLSAIRDGRPVDTTMGFTPLEGLVMATRSGTIDPGLLAWLITEMRLPVREVFDTLEHRSGLAGLAGGSGDLRAVLEARDRGDQEAALAFDVYRHSLTRHAGMMIAALGGLDLLVFTGGIGEHHPAVRASLCRSLEFLGVAVNSLHNDACDGDGDIGAGNSDVRVAVVEAREDLVIARQTSALLSGSADAS